MDADSESGTLVAHVFEMRSSKFYTGSVSASEWGPSTGYGELGSLSDSEKVMLASTTASWFEFSAEGELLAVMPEMATEESTVDEVKSETTIVISKELNTTSTVEARDALSLCGTKLDGKPMFVWMGQGSEDTMAIHGFSPLTNRSFELSVCIEDWKSLGFGDLDGMSEEEKKDLCAKLYGMLRLDSTGELAFERSVEEAAVETEVAPTLDRETRTLLHTSTVKLEGGIRMLASVWREDGFSGLKVHGLVLNTLQYHETEVTKAQCSELGFDMSAELDGELESKVCEALCERLKLRDDGSLDVDTMRVAVVESKMADELVMSVNEVEMKEEAAPMRVPDARQRALVTRGMNLNGQPVVLGMDADSESGCGSAIPLADQIFKFRSVQEKNTTTASSAAPLKEENGGYPLEEGSSKHCYQGPREEAFSYFSADIFSHSSTANKGKLGCPDSCTDSNHSNAPQDPAHSDCPTSVSSTAPVAEVYCLESCSLDTPVCFIDQMDAEGRDSSTFEIAYTPQQQLKKAHVEDRVCTQFVCATSYNSSSYVACYLE